MIVEHIQKVRDAVNESHQFDMTEWGYLPEEGNVFYRGHYCGSPACIGGHTEAVMVAEGLEIEHENDIIIWLGLDPIQSSRLFNPNGVEDGVYIEDVTQDHAVRCLDHLIKTGEINWEATK